MAFEDGASLSQSEVHERGFEEIKNAFAKNLQYTINYGLLPKMLMHGFPLQGCTFEWDTAAQYSPEEMKNIEAMLLQYYDIEPQYFIDKYNIGIAGVRATNAPFA
jgi:hypothetical protein